MTLTLDKALEIALDENTTMKVAAEEIALKKVASKETWQNLLPEASISGSVDHTIKAAEMKLNDMSFKMGQDGTNTANAGLNINLPLFVPGVYRAMSMTKTDIELAVEKSRASKLDLVNQVSKAYYQLMLAQDSYEAVSYTHLEEAIELSKKVAAKVAELYNLPVFLYEKSATAPHRENLASVRKGEFEGMAEKIKMCIRDRCIYFEAYNDLVVYLLVLFILWLLVSSVIPVTISFLSLYFY